MTYTSLREDLQRYLERGTSTDPVVYAELPTLIMLAQRRIARELKIQGLQVVVSASMVAGTAIGAAGCFGTG